MTPGPWPGIFFWGKRIGNDDCPDSGTGEAGRDKSTRPGPSKFVAFIMLLQRNDIIVSNVSPWPCCLPFVLQVFEDAVNSRMLFGKVPDIGWGYQGAETFEGYQLEVALQMFGDEGGIIIPAAEIFALNMCPGATVS